MVLKRQQQSKIFLIIALWGVVLVGIVFWMYQQQHKFLRYTNNDKGFSVKYPAGWEVKENYKGTAVMFLSPLENDLDLFRENVNVVILPVPAGIRTLRDYSQKAIKQMVAVFENNLQVLDSYETIFAGEKGYWFSYVGRGGETEVQMLHVWAIKEGWVYQFTYAAVEENFDTFIKDVKKMIRSFRVIS